MKLIYLHAHHRCAPCRDMRRRIELVESRLAPELRPMKRWIEAVDVDAEPEVAAAYGVTVVPSFVVINDAGVVLWHQTGRISTTRFEQVLEMVARGSWNAQQFPATAPSADVVFYRTYSRRTGDGQRESWAETVERVMSGMAKLGGFTADEEQLVRDQAMAQHTLPSGRWLWVGGTPWIEDDASNYSGAYNCTSTDIVDLESFGLLMDLAMVGSGTGAVLEDDQVAQLPPVVVPIVIGEISGFGDGPGQPTTSSTGEITTGRITLRVGDSRQGWVRAYQQLIDWAHDPVLWNHLLDNGHSQLTIDIDLTQVRPAGTRLAGFGGTANPSQLPVMFTKVAGVLTDAVGGQLTPLQACLLIDAAAACVVAGNIRRSAGMRQFSSGNAAVADAKANLYVQDSEGNWTVDPKREDLRMANHTRCFHTRPSAEEVLDAVTKQFHSGEGAIQYVPEAVARSNADLLDDPDDREAFLASYCEGYGREFLCSLIDTDRPDLDKDEKEEELDHRMRRYGLNPCGEILGKDFHCNLAEVHLNTLDPHDLEAQERAFQAAALQVSALLHHEFEVDRYAYSRMLDPIVGVSFTGLFDFWVTLFGVKWLNWMMAGRPAYDGQGTDFASIEAGYLAHWRRWVEDTVERYCAAHGLKTPSRTTTVQPAGTKSLLTGASSGWHPPKAQRFIRRITVGRAEPVAMAAMAMGFNVIPAQSARDDEGRLLDDIWDKRSREWLIEVPTEVPWANLPGADAIDLSKLPIEAQWGLYMNVQQHYTTHNTSATLEITEAEVPVLAELISEAIESDAGYISAAILQRFDASGGTFPRLPFEPIDRATYQELQAMVMQRRSESDFHSALLKADDGAELEQSEGNKFHRIGRPLRSVAYSIS